ncbi:glycosyltransferase [Roseomonas sp. 18066]|uniref:glycosyltransferase n=1 Tax=Roseomonas sp. 18066 TaxID=2681412 RepID=UPI0013587646|nr:glycosyltransferase [Roseomonas sp. 18066]
MAFKAAIDSMAFGSGFLMISGWLALPRDRDWPARILLQAGADSFPIGHWFPRRDLPDKEEGPRFLAFREDFPWAGATPPAAPLSLVVEGEVAITADRWAPFAPQGALEAVGQASISGWLIDPALWHGTGEAAVILPDGTRLAVTPTITRPDLTGGQPRPDRPHGFAITAVALARAVAEAQPFKPGAAMRLVLESSGRKVAEKEASFAPVSLGRLETFHEGAVRGWAAFREPRWAVPAVEILLDGVIYDTIPAARHRKDLQDRGTTNGQGGFVFPIASQPRDGGPLTVTARIAGERSPLPGEPLELPPLPATRGRAEGPWQSLATRRPQVAIVIPIYNAPDDLAACLRTLVAETGGDAELLLIDDASPDPRVAEVLAPYEGRRNIRVLRNEKNLGFTGTCNRGIEAAGRRDVVLLNSDTLLPPRWLEGLTAAAYASPRTASASPLSDNAGAFSAPRLGGANVLPRGLSTVDIGRLVTQAARAAYPEVPTGHGFCLFLRRDALDAVGVLDVEAFPRGYGEENDLCMRALRAGWQHVVDDRTYVLHRQSASFGAARTNLLREGRARLDARFPEYKPLIGVFQKDPRQLAMRWRVRLAFQGATAPRPRVLFVISTESGGTPQTNMDLMLGLEDRYEPWLLVCNGQQLTLQRLIDGILQPVEQRALDAPIQMAVHRSAQYDAIIAGWLLLHAIELLHIRHLAWHGLGLPEVARALGIPVVLSLHDFYIVCPTIKLLDGEMRHCGGVCTQGEAECRAELWPADQVPPLRNNFVHRWREMIRPALAACDAFVTTSAHAREVITASYPALAERDFRVLAHGRSFESFLAPAPRAAAPADGVARILVPGNISAAKGARLIEAMVALDQGRRLEFHILGDAGALREAPGLMLHGRYARDEFLDRVETLDVQFGAVLSIWPETYCHTLTELWAAGLPVFALDLGAVGERIRAQGGGWLFETREPSALLEAVLTAAADLAGVDRRLEELRSWQASEAAGARNIRAMARDYDLLYREVAHRRLAFAEPYRPPQTWLLWDLRGRRGPLPPALRNIAASPVLFHAVASLDSELALAEGTAGLVLLADRLDSGLAQQVLAHAAAQGLACLFCSATPPPPGRVEAWPRTTRAALALSQPGEAAWPLPVLDLGAMPIAFQQELARFGAGEAPETTPRAEAAARRMRVWVSG